MEIDKMPLNDLKALAYDMLAKIQECQRNLDIINKEIVKKAIIPVNDNNKG